MAEASDPGGASGGRIRRLLPRPEAATLLGMALCIGSLFLTWPLALDLKLAAPAMVVNPVRIGPPAEARLPLTAGAIAAGVLLAVTGARPPTVPTAFVQALCGLVCLVSALLHFGTQPGPVAALVGGGLIAFGAIDRLAATASVDA